MSPIQQRGLRFRQLHTTDTTFLMPNAWDAGSALMLASMGFAAIASTSAGVAFSLGRPDTEAAVDRDTLLERIAAMASATQLPLNADLQSGYGTSAEAVGVTLERAVRAGAVGANIEDAREGAAEPLWDTEEACERIRAARRAVDATGVPFVLTARTDTHLCGMPHPLALAIERCNRYREAGADCLFVPGASDPGSIGTLVREIQGPITVVMGLTGSTLTLSQLADLGVRRVSIGGSLARATYGLIRRAAAEMIGQGTFSYADQQIPDAELSAFFSRQQDLLRAM